MRRTDQTSVVSPQGHILPQGKKDNVSDGVQCFFAPSFFHRVSGSYQNEEETPVIKPLCKKKNSQKNNNDKEKEKMKKEVPLLLLQIWKTGSLIDTNSVPSW